MLKLGLTSFGGPIAHLGYLNREFVERRKWIDGGAFGDVLALCNFLPGPTSSQVGIYLGIQRAGLGGGIAAWLGFTLPSAVLMTLFAYGVESLGNSSGAAWIHGLRVVAVPVVALAVWGMATNLCPDRVRGTLAILGAIASMALPAGMGPIAIIVTAGVIGWLIYRKEPLKTLHSVAAPIKRRHAVLAWLTFFGLLFVLPVVMRLVPDAGSLSVFTRFYRVGSLVLGGGHVVLPLLESEVVQPGWTTSERFLAGYGAAQAVPGPLFSFSSYLGAISNVGPGGWLGGALALSAIYLPAFLLVIGSLPFWERLRASSHCQAALKGANAAVVGLLLSALYDPAWTGAIHSHSDFGLALGGFALLAFWRVPPWLVVVLSAIVGALLQRGVAGGP